MTTPVVTVMFGKVAVSDDVSLPKLPESVTGPCQPPPTSIDTFPEAVKASKHVDPVVHVAATPTPGVEIFTPGNGM